MAQVPHSNATLAANLKKQKIVGMEPTLPMIRDLSVTTNKIENRTTPSNQRQKKNWRRIKKINTPRLHPGETLDARAYSIEDPTEYFYTSTADCNGTPKEDWLTRQAIPTIKRHKTKNEQQKEYPECIKECDDQNMTTKRPFAESNQERVYVFDKDYRCDPWDRPDLYDQSSLTLKDQAIAPTADQRENAHMDQTPSQLPKQDSNSSNKKPIFTDHFPASLNSIKEYVTENDGNACIPLHSTIQLKKKRKRMLYLPLEFGEITTDGLPIHRRNVIV